MKNKLEQLTLVETCELQKATDYLIKYYGNLSEKSRGIVSQRFQEYENKYRKYTQINETILKELEKRLSDIIDEKDMV